MVQVVGLEGIEAMGSVQDVISSVEVSDVNLSIGDESGVKMRREPSTRETKASAAWRCAGQISGEQETRL